MSTTVTETWQRKRLAPIVVHTRESADTLSLEELVRRLLAADQDKPSTK